MAKLSVYGHSLIWPICVDQNIFTRKAFFSFLSASILLSLQNQTFGSNEINWSDSNEEDSSNRRNDAVQARNTLFPESRSSDDENEQMRSDDVINVTPSSFSDIFVKPRLAALAVQSGMVLVKKKTSEAPLTATPFTASATAAATASTTSSTYFPSTTPSTTTVFRVTTTTTPYVFVKKKTPNALPDDDVDDVPILVVGPNSEISFREENSYDGDQSDSVLDTWKQQGLNSLPFICGVTDWPSCLRPQFTGNLLSTGYFC